MSATVLETTTTTTRTVWEKQRAPVWLLLLPVAGLIGLLLIGVTVVRGSVEEDIVQRSRAALADAGVPLDAVTIRADGRDATISGLLDGASVDEVAATVAAVDGVRTVDVARLQPLTPTDDDAAQAAGQDPGAAPAEATLTVQGTEIALTGSLGEAPDTAALARAFGSLSVADATEVDDGVGGLAGATLTVTGTVADEATREQILTAAQQVVGVDGTVADELTVDPELVGGEGEAAADAVDRSDTDRRVTVDGLGSGDVDDPWITYFDSASTEVTDTTGAVAEATEVIADVAPGALVRVVGYADAEGDAAANLELSEQRAEAVADQLRAGRPELTYEISASGEDDPLASDEESRRVEFWVVDR